MGTFTIIFLLIALIGGMLSSSKPTINTNENIKPIDSSTEYSKETLTKLYVEAYSSKDYVETIKACNRFISFYQDNIQVLFMLTMALITQRNYFEAEKHIATIKDRFKIKTW